MIKMLPKQDNFLDTFIVDFYSMRDEDLIIKPLIGWDVDNKLSYYVGSRNFSTDITISSDDRDGFRHVYIDVLISLQTDGGGIFRYETRLLSRNPYFNAMYRILKLCGFLSLPAWYLPVRLPPVCMNGLYYV